MLSSPSPLNTSGGALATVSRRSKTENEAPKRLGFSLLPPAAVVMSFGLLLIVARGELEASVGGLIIGRCGADDGWY